MSMLTDPQKAALLQLITDEGLAGEADNDTVANRLNAPGSESVQVPTPFSISDVLGVLSSSAQDAIMDHPLGSEIIAKINANDRQAVGLYATKFAQRGVVTADEKAAVLAILGATHSVTRPAPSPFAAAFPGFRCEHEGVGYNRCIGALVAEARS